MVQIAGTSGKKLDSRKARVIGLRSSADLCMSAEPRLGDGILAAAMLFLQIDFSAFPSQSRQMPFLHLYGFVSHGPFPTCRAG
jgi:hypothetical protein